MINDLPASPSIKRKKAIIDGDNVKSSARTYLFAAMEQPAHSKKGTFSFKKALSLWRISNIKGRSSRLLLYFTLGVRRNL